MVTAIADRIALDDELQSEFFGNLVAAALDLVPDQAMRAIADRIAEFRVPELTLRDGRNSTDVLAEAGIYEPKRAGELVFAPLLERWNIFSRTDFGTTGEAARAEIAHLRG